MHIPTQPDGPREPRADRRTGHEDAVAPVTPVVPGPAPTGTEGLRARRQHLVGQLRTVTYWQRLAQARVDLVVAGLLYGAPAPTTTRWTAPAGPRTAAALGALVAGLPGLRGPGPVEATDATPADDLHALAAPPEGLDVSLLIGPGSDGAGPGARLDRLRRSSALLAGRRRVLEEELDAVTQVLHDRLASDGDEAGYQASEAVEPLFTGPTA